MIEPFKRFVRRHWPHLRLRTILLLTFVFVAALPGFGALFLRLYENTLVRQTEAELVAQGAALSATAAADWPGAATPSIIGAYAPEPPSIDLRLTHILPERPPPRRIPALSDRKVLAWSNHLRPILQLTSRTTLASIILLDQRGRILLGPQVGFSHGRLPELKAALAGRPATTLRRNASYRPYYAFEWLSRASNLRIHHVRPIVADRRVVGVLLLPRSPRALFVGLYEDRGKIILGVVLIFATLVVLSGLLSRGIVRPVEALGEATRAVASGGGQVPPPPTTAAVEIQALYRDFSTMAEAIDRRSSYLRDFAHAVSHEFKTPLAGISGAIELLQDHPEMTPVDQERFLANAAADAARLSRLVGRLLDLARADMAQSTDAVTDVSTVLSQIADAYNGEGFRVIVDLERTVPAVAAPPAAFEAALVTLVENSRQARASAVLITVRSSVDHMTISIADDGPGIPLGDHERIFEPFFTSRRASGGTGLGLPIACSLLRAHHATLRLLPATQGGATFEMVLSRA